MVDPLVLPDDLPGRTVVYAHPWTGRPGQDLLVEHWDEIPGARSA